MNVAFDNQRVIFKVAGLLRTGRVLKVIEAGGVNYYKVQGDKIYPWENDLDLIFFTDEVIPYKPKKE